MSYDEVAIIGGGPVGALAALVLKSFFKRVVLIEQRSLASIQAATKSRTLALNAKSLQLLTAFNLLEPLAQNLSPIREVKVSVEGSWMQSKLRASHFNLSQLGAVIEQHFLEQNLYQSLSASGIDILENASLTALNWEQKWQLSYVQEGVEKQLESEFCIGCDGERSLTRQQLGIGVSTHDYEHIACVSILQFERDHQGTALEIFCEDGTLAVLPMTHNRATCIWTSSPLDNQLTQSYDNQRYINALGQRFKRLAWYQPSCLFRLNFPLRRVVANRMVARDALLLGNAAHSLHPIAAQGLNLSLRDLDRLKQCHQGTASIAQWLENFANNNQDVNRMQTYTHTLAQTMGQSSVPLWLKQKGLSAFEHLPGMKTLFGRLNLGFGV